MSKLLPTLSKDDAGADRSKRAEKPAAGRRRATPISASVNLLSPWVFEELRVRQLRQRFMVAGVVLLAVLVVAFGLLRLTLSNARSELQADEASAAELQQQISALGDVKAYVGNVTIRGKDVADMMAGDVAVSKALDALSASLPDGAGFDSVIVTLPENPALLPANSQEGDVPVCPGPDPFGTLNSVGCIELTGSAKSRADVAEMIQALEEQKVLQAPFITITTRPDNSEGGPAFEFTGSASIVDVGLSGRYDDLAPGSTDDTNGSSSAEGEN